MFYHSSSSVHINIRQIPHVIFNTTGQFFLKFCINLSCHERQLLCTFLAETLYTFITRNPLKCKILRLSSAHVKIRQIPHANFETTSQFLFKFFIILSVSTNKSSVNFELMDFLLFIKRSHQSPNFETFKCSGENFPNSSSHFLNRKSVFLQILDHSSVSWKLTPLYFFRSNIIYFAQIEPIKRHAFENFKCSGQNSPNSCHFWNNKSVFLQFLHDSSVLCITL